MGRGLVVGVVVVVVGAGVGVALYLTRQHVDDEQKAVVIHASYEKAECGAATPVKVTVDNGADKTLKALSFELDVFLDGDSTNLSGSDRLQTWTKIVKPHGSASTCLGLPREARDRIAHGAGRRAYTVRAEGRVAAFYDEGEFIPPEAPASVSSQKPLK
jgi:hypothetical protein